MTDQKQIWDEFLTAYYHLEEKFSQVRINIPKSQFLEIVRGLFARSEHIMPLIYLLDHLPIADLQILLPELVGYVSTGHRTIIFFNDLVLKIPKDWLAKNIEQHADKFLNDESDEEYWQFLGLYSEIDRDLALRLAKRAIKSPNPHIRDAGETYLDKLKTR